MIQQLLSLCRRLVGKPSEMAAGERPEDERRVWVRYPSNAQTIVKPLNNGVDTRFSARVRNVSRGGVSLDVSQEFQPGDLVSIELPGATPTETDTVLACVIHVQPTAEQQWALGCTFSEELDEHELAAFGARKERPSNHDPDTENRAWKRFGCD